MISPNTPYLRRIDHLRFFAAALVVVYHAFHVFSKVPLKPQNPLMSLIYEGHTGVSLFMVLSGFIFATISYQKTIDYWAFLYNRFLRIYPLVLLAVCYAAYSHRDQVTFLDLIAMIFPFGNLKGGVQSIAQGDFSALWTVSVEFQFYLIFPFIKKAFDREGLRWISGLLLLFMLLRALQFAITGSAHDLGYWTIFGKIDQFIIGIVFGYRYRERSSECASPWFLFGAVVLMLGCIQAFSSAGGFYGNGVPSKKIWWIFWPTVEGLFWATLITTYVQCNLRFGDVFENELAKLGAMSFSVYVFHSLIIKAIKIHFPNPVFTGQIPLDSLIFAVAVVLPATFLFSSLSYRIIEKPFLERRVAYAHQQN
jgi:peptidoglycan/LPS O-acetylase OafA/YrhL